MTKYCRDQAREELILMLGGGAAAGLAGEIPVIGARAFSVAVSAVQVAIVARIASIYGVNLLAAGGAGALAGTIMAVGGANFVLMVAEQFAGLLPPGFRQVARPTLGAGSALAFGVAAIAYFETAYPNQIFGEASSSPASELGSASSGDPEPPASANSSPHNP